MAKTVAIIQASMGSQRLPGKTMADICGKPMLERVVERVQRARLVDEVVVATTTRYGDDVIMFWCVANGVLCYRCGVYLRPGKGDLLAIYYQAAQWRQAGVIVRITADCPLLDPAVIDNVIATLARFGGDYASNVEPPLYPDGLDAEAFTIDALRRAYAEARLPSEREHVTPWMRTNLQTSGLIPFGRDLSAERWTVDEAADLEFVRAVYAELGEAPFGMAEVLALLERRPELRQINAGIQRNESYWQQLNAEKNGS